MRITPMIAIGAGIVLAAGALQAQEQVAAAKKPAAKGPAFTSVTPEMLWGAAKDGKNWTMYGHDY
jgi:hypothetical protein